MITEEQVRNALKNVYDPEIPVNIVDLGMIYEIKVEDDVVSVKMTLTAPGCPLASTIIQQVESEISGLNPKDQKVDLVFEPQWTPDLMSDEAKETLGWQG